MEKIILDFNATSSKEEIQEYLAGKFQFPDYYGKNLDALYDCLTSITSPTAVGFALPAYEYDEDDNAMMSYLEKVAGVFKDAEEENKNLAVIFF